MGCDIHAFIEIDHGQADLWPFGEFHFPRSYRLFSALAGVRTRDDETPLYPARGLPDSISYEVIAKFYQRIVPDDQSQHAWMRGIDFVTESEANETLKLDKSKLCIVNKQRFLADPDWHDPSWLTHQEILDALAHHGIPIDELSIEFKTAMEAMLMLSKHYGTNKVRLVFWFDS